MVKTEKENAEIPSQAFEIIELAIDDIDTLTRAFEVIQQACQEVSNPHLCLEPAPPKIVLN